MSISRLLFILIIVFGVACSDSTSGPEDQSGDNSGSIVIDAGGGKVEADGACIVVPPGAYSQSHTLGITSDDSVGLPEEAVTSAYTVTGLSETLSKPLEIRLRHNGDLSGDSFISLELVMDGGFVDEPSAVIYHLPATVSDSLLVATFSPYDSDGTAKYPHYLPIPADEEPFVWIEMKLIGISDAEITQSSHFINIMPKSVKSVSDVLIPALENAYKLFRGMGFDYSIKLLNNTTLDSISVQMLDFTNLPENLKGKSYTGNADLYQIFDDIYTLYENRSSRMYLIFDLQPTINSDNLLRMAVRKFFTLLMHINDPKMLYHSSWFNVASSAWMAANKVSETKEIPIEFTGNELEPLYGPVRGEFLNVNSLEINNRYGSGMTAMLDYHITQRGQGIELILETARKIRNGSGPTEAFYETVEGNPNTWFPDFIRDYIKGQVYNVPPSQFLGGIRDSFLIATEADTSRTFTADYSDLSAKLYRVNLDYAAFKEGDAIEFNLESATVGEDMLTTLVFSIHNNELQYIGEGKTFTVENISAMVQDNADLLVAVINSSYNGDTISSGEVQLTARVTAILDIEYDLTVVPSFTLWHTGSILQVTAEVTSELRLPEKTRWTFDFGDANIETEMIEHSATYYPSWFNLKQMTHKYENSGSYRIIVIVSDDTAGTTLATESADITIDTQYFAHLATSGTFQLGAGWFHETVKDSNGVLTAVTSSSSFSNWAFGYNWNDRMSWVGPEFTCEWSEQYDEDTTFTYHIEGRVDYEVRKIQEITVSHKEVSLNYGSTGRERISYYDITLENVPLQISGGQDPKFYTYITGSENIRPYIKDATRYERIEDSYGPGQDYYNFFTDFKWDYYSSDWVLNIEIK